MQDKREVPTATSTAGGTNDGPGRTGKAPLFMQVWESSGESRSNLIGERVS